MVSLPIANQSGESGAPRAFTLRAQWGVSIVTLLGLTLEGRTWGCKGHMLPVVMGYPQVCTVNNLPAEQYMNLGWRTHTGRWLIKKCMWLDVNGQERSAVRGQIRLTKVNVINVSTSLAFPRNLFFPVMLTALSCNPGACEGGARASVFKRIPLSSANRPAWQTLIFATFT